MNDPVTNTEAPATDTTKTPETENSLLNTPPPTDGEKTGDATQQDASQGTEKQADEDAKATGAPEKYEFTAPAGMELDADAVAKFEPIARDLNLTNEQANKLVALQAELVAAQTQANIQQVAEWVSTAKADPDIGGAQFDASLSHARKAVDFFGTPQLKEDFDRLGFGNHPELFRAFVKIGRAMAEDKFETGQPAQKPVSQADRLYGNTTHN